MRFGAKLLLVSALLIAMGSAFHLNYATEVAYPYEVEVHSHLVNAAAVQTPEELIREVGLAAEGMRRLGLEDHMSKAYFWWDKFPSNSMAFQYEYLDQILDRAESVIAWRDTELAEAGGREQFQDVYEAKMGSLKTMLHRGQDGIGADWIAGQAFLLAYHPIYYVGEAITMPLILGGALWLTVGASLALTEPKARRFRDIIYREEDVLPVAALIWAFVAALALFPIALAVTMAAFA